MLQGVALFLLSSLRSDDAAIGAGRPIPALDVRVEIPRGEADIIAFLKLL